MADSADVLSEAETQEVQQTLTGLAQQHGIHLLVAYVSTFESPSDRTAWTKKTATLNQLGDNDGVLGIAVDQRLYDLNVADDFPVSASDLTKIEQQVTSKLAGDDWAGAALALADGVSAEAEPNIAAQTKVVEKLKSGLEGMKEKLVQLKSKRDELVARQKSAAAQSQVHDALKAKNSLLLISRCASLVARDPLLALTESFQSARRVSDLDTPSASGID
ncbi:TPM domain-containing protein [Pseudoclavibacter soli]|uniref:TPM domain-containing protein n=1 Tax=Pseudoclavibacter soli TaxID=452623 RepID=UPI0003FBF812|nr:TPM domain-containing protein [Pseudoclavibacter soli]